jgi:hypothetical protein
MDRRRQMPDRLKEMQDLFYADRKQLPAVADRVARAKD